MADLDDTNDFSEEELSADSDALADDEDSDEDALVEADEIVDEDGDDDEDIDGLLTNLGADERPGDARRRIEEYLEMKRAARELSELDAYDFD